MVELGCELNSATSGTGPWWRRGGMARRPAERWRG